MVQTRSKTPPRSCWTRCSPNNARRAAPSVPGWSEDTLIAYKRAHSELVDLKGIGIYAPFITDQGILDRLELAAASPDGKGSLECGSGKISEARALQGAEGGRGTWPRLVYDDLKRTIPAELMVTIDGIGELQTGDRADVAQIIMSIESVLNGLDRAIARARRDIVDAVERGPATPTMEELVASSLKSGVATLPAAAEAKTTFGPPWIRLAPPVSLQTLRDVDELKQFQFKAGSSSAGPGANGARPDVVDEAVERFGVIERALSVTERTVLRALTHVRFGLGPMSSNRLLQEPPKSGIGLEPPKSGIGLEPPKSGIGSEPPKSGIGEPGGASTGNLRTDLALTRVAYLFRQVGESLMRLESAATDVEVAARATLVLSPPAPSSEANAAMAQGDRACVSLARGGLDRRTPDLASGACTPGVRTRARRGPSLVGHEAQSGCERWTEQAVSQIVVTP